MQGGEELHQIVDESYIEAVNEFMNSVAQYLAGSISISVTSISFESLNLEALANALGVFGITDPIGEIKQWFYDRLKEISSFFSGVVEAIITPIKNLTQSIWDFIQGIPDKVIGGIRSFIDILSKSVSSIAESLSKYFNQIIGQISNVISSISSALSNAASSIINTLSNALSSIGKALQNLVTDLINRVMSGLQIIGSALGDVFSKLSSVISEAISGALNAIKSFFTTIGETIKNFWQDVINNLSKVGSMIWEGLQSGLKWLWDSIQGIVGKIWEGLQTFGSVLAESFGKVWEWIQSGVQWLWNTIQGILSRIWEGLVAFGQAVANFFGQVWNWIQSGIQWLWQQLQGFGSWLWGLIQQGLQWLWNTLASIGAKIWEGLQWVWNIITDAVRKLWEWIWNGLQWVWQQLTNVGQMIWNGLLTAWNAIQGFFARLWEGLTTVGQWIWNGILQFSELVQRAFQEIGNRVMGALTVIGNTLSNFGRMIVDGFTTVARMITDFAKIFDKWASALMGGLSALGNAFGQFLQTIANLPQTIQNVFQGITDFFTKLGEAFAEFVRNPAEWFRKHVIEPIWNGMLWLGQKIWDGLKTVWQYIVQGFTWFVDVLKGIGASILNALSGFAVWLVEVLQGIAMNFINGIRGFAEKLGSAIVEFIESILLPHSPSTIDVAGQIVKKSLEEIAQFLHPSPPVMLTPGKLTAAWLKSMYVLGTFYVFTRSVEVLFRTIGRFGESTDAAARLLRRVTFRIGIPGTHAEIYLELPSSVARALAAFAKEIGRLGERFSDPLWYGLSFWYGRVLTPLLMYELRNLLPLEIPTFREAEDMWNRVWAVNVASGAREARIPEDLGGKPDVVLESIKYFMKIKGYSDYLLKMAFADENEFYIKVKDRFEKERIIPLADAWRIPSPSDLVTMMIRDVFSEFKDFEIAMRVHGFNKDTAILYYYLHFKYPSPEKLAEFFWRGVAGVLWYPDSLMEQSTAAALGLQGVQAKAPKELNFQFQALKEAINKYMKWHDYAPFPWIPGFTTDKAIIADLMADLPDKVDFRWMTRWGIFEHLSKLGIGITTPIDQLISSLASASGNELVSETVSPDISLDVSLLARFLVAKGVHPYFAAISAVAEAHTMLTDEMTLLRSGFLELYRWGMANINQLEKLMSGLFVVKFTTAYLDLGSGTWQKINYRKPVLWLPAERRLLQLRAAMDRYYNLFRDFMREVERGVRVLALHTKSTVQEVEDYINSLSLDAETKAVVSNALAALKQSKTADDLIREYADIVLTNLSNEIRSISGVDIKFTIDKTYIDTWVKMAELTRDIESRTWIRHYATRLVAWIIYRTSYGWTPVEKFRNLTAILTARGWITPEEKEFLDTVAEWIYGIVRREMIPTPLQLATFSEYMKVPDDLIDKVLEEHRVPEEYRQLYKQYIAYRFIKSDYRTFINRARRAYVLGVINDAEWGKILSEAVEKYGFRQEEIEIMKRIAELEELMNDVRAWRPSLTTIATISEVVPIPEDVMSKIFEKFKIDPLIAPYVKEYVKRRPLLDELRLLVNEYYRMKYYAGVYKQQIPAEIEQAVQRYMQLIGFSKEELEIRQLVATVYELIETWRENAREYIPTPSMLATIAEYVPSISDEMISKVLEARGVPKEWRAIWVQYIKARAIADEVRSLLSAFYRMKRYAIYYGYTVPKDIEDAVMKYASMIGITDVEKSIRDLTAYIEATTDMIRSGEVYPTLSTLASMAEYIDIPMDYIKKVIEVRRIEPTYAQLWMQYISARSISGEVNRVVTAFTNLYIRFAVPDDIVKRVTELMKQGGWTDREITVFSFELELRRAYRVLTMLIPSIRQFITDAQYLPNYDSLFQDLLQAYAIDVEKYKKQVEYYKRLLKNRRLWRHFSWYRTQLTYAYMYGAMNEDQIRQRLQKFVEIGLLDPDEVEIIIDGIKIRAAAYAAYRASRYGS
jgi:phage-related protein/transcriptional regulator with XRE-family HTH domain